MLNFQIFCVHVSSNDWHLLWSSHNHFDQPDAQRWRTSSRMSQVLVWPKGQFNFINLKFQILFKHLSETDIWTCGINVSQVLVLPKSKLDFLNLKCDLLFMLCITNYESFRHRIDRTQEKSINPRIFSKV